jgi:prophage regulatory protein
MPKNNNATPIEGRVIGSAELRRLLPFSDAHFWRLEKAGAFPRRIKIGRHRVGWALEEVLAWVEEHKSRRTSHSDGRAPR